MYISEPGTALRSVSINYGVVGSMYELADSSGGTGSRTALLLLLISTKKLRDQNNYPIRMRGKENIIKGLCILFTTLEAPYGPCGTHLSPDPAALSTCLQSRSILSPDSFSQQPHFSTRPFNSLSPPQYVPRFMSSSRSVKLR